MSWWVSISGSETSTSEANNTSVVSVTLSVGWDNGSWAADNPSFEIIIDNESFIGTANFNTGRSSSGSQVIATRTKTITHNDDGSKYVVIAGGYAGNGSGWKSQNSGIQLTTFSRNSSISIQNTSVVAGGTQKITVTKASSSYTVSIKVYINKTYYLYAYNGINFTVPLNWLNAMPKATSSNVNVEVNTFSGFKLIGTATSSFTMTCPSYEPTASRTLAPTATPSVFGQNYVQLLSKVNVVTTASGYQGSTIASIVTTVEGLTFNGSDVNSEYLKNSGSVSVSTVVTDTRGKTKTLNGNVTGIISYHYPRMTISSRTLTSLSNNIINLNTSISPVSNLNAKEVVSVNWTCSDGTSGQLAGSSTIPNYDDTITYEHANIDPTLTYSYSATIQDSIGTNQQAGITGIPAISRHAGGDGVTLGGEAGSGGFNCLWDANFYEDLSVSGVGSFSGGLTANGLDVGRICNPVNVPDGVRYYRCFCYGVPSSTGDKYYHLISSTNALYTGVQLNGASTITWTKYADHIIEQGTSGIWRYRKWNNGASECWGTYTNNSTPYLNAWQNMHVYQITGISLPSGLFDSIPDINFSGTISSGNTRYLTIPAGFYSESSSSFGVWLSCSSKPTTAVSTIHFSVKGKWK